ncbi:MAG: acetyl-CoA carboxylase biotin carboxyl carrier protein [Proteobacteria bacterium]|nr:acetyl-CoA carboxylase biotin carboxyl carrier protein [Pseudomonadota bacterium]
MDIDLKQLRELMRAIKEFGLSQLVVEKGDERIELHRVAKVSSEAPALAGPATQSELPPSMRAESTPAVVAPKVTEDPNTAYVTSPFVGTFYRAPSPGEKPYVEVNQHLAPGQVLCIVEAMKLMNEIEAEYECTVLEILIQDAQPVEYGERLFKVQKV